MHLASSREKCIWIMLQMGECCLYRMPKAELLELLLDVWPERGCQEKAEPTTNGAPPRNGKKNGFRQHLNGHTPHTTTAGNNKAICQQVIVEQLHTYSFSLADMHCSPDETSFYTSRGIGDEEVSANIEFFFAEHSNSMKDLHMDCRGRIFGDWWQHQRLMWKAIWLPGML